MTMVRFSLPRLALAALALLAAAAPASAAPPLALFAADAPLRLTIQAPLRQLMADRSLEGAVSATVTDPSGLKLPAAIALRGLTRRTSEICDFPPLRINFPAPPPAQSVFAGQDKLKLVTHCKSGAGFQQKVLLEYATYRMYNQLTERSMRVRLANIDYVDSDGRPITSRVGFFLEDVGDIARRNDMAEVRAASRIPTNWLSAPDAARYALFQHLIANHDWSMRAGPVGSKCCHNAELIGASAPGGVIPVPYDFDFSGLVDAPYATPPEQLRISSVRQRLYRGYCAHSAQLAAAAGEFRRRQGALYGVLAQIPGLEPGTQSRATRFMDGFFAQIATEDGLGRLARACIG